MITSLLKVTDWTEECCVFENACCYCRASVWTETDKMLAKSSKISGVISDISLKSSPSHPITEFSHLQYIVSSLTCHPSSSNGQLNWFCKAAGLRIQSSATSAQWARGIGVQKYWGRRPRSRGSYLPGQKCLASEKCKGFSWKGSWRKRPDALSRGPTTHAVSLT